MNNDAIVAQLDELLTEARFWDGDKVSDFEDHVREKHGEASLVLVDFLEHVIEFRKAMDERE